MREHRLSVARSTSPRSKPVVNIKRARGFAPRATRRFAPDLRYGSEGTCRQSEPWPRGRRCGGSLWTSAARVNR